ncbi:Radical SAM domain protein [Ferroglobus placidus DSM 10642]|uniref:Radical SAM domain protein n=1 Tax=Ferroglobus placidus (strain DSM 10642 / AEDII12DO) TaxID=589924 RepID=D3S1K7_FERPA|nr:radical SAM protein [Ferroglobus placidus]ADC66471.1 Radical SAM domain protein [Ferroglobus placidus DSM 10642]
MVSEKMTVQKSLKMFSVDAEEEMPRVVVAEVPNLKGEMERRVIKVGDGSIIKLFDRTPIPKKDTDVVCPHFLELKWANGCPFNCAWCYLQGTFRFLDRGKKPFIKDWKKIELHLWALFQHNSRRELLNAGELSDSLIGEHERPPASVRLAKMFQEQDNYELLLVTKSNRIDNLLRIEPENVIVSFSINAFPVAKRWEKGAPHPLKRIEAARKLYDHGYKVRVRIDPMVPITGWKSYYRELVEEIIKRFEPERFTLGTLRGLSTTIRCAKDTSWVKYLDESSNWGLKPRFNVRLTMYRFIIDLLEEYGFINYGLCKETVGMWKALEMDYREIKCNCLL